MILSSAREYERYSNPEIVERESDNIEVPQVRQATNLSDINSVFKLIVCLIDSSSKSCPICKKKWENSRTLCLTVWKPEPWSMLAWPD